MSAMTAYLVTFALSVWPPRPTDVHRLREIVAIAADVASTDATPEEALTLINIAALESGFERTARGKLGERGAWQVMPPAVSYAADEALRRVRVQGMQSFCGCVRPCPKTVAHRTDKAILWRLAFDPPAPRRAGTLLAVAP